MTISKSFLTFVFDIYSTWKIWRFTKDCLQNKWKCTFTKCVPVLLESLLFCHCVFLLFLQRTLVWLFLLKFEWLLLKEKTLSMQRFVFADLFFFPKWVWQVKKASVLNCDFQSFNETKSSLQTQNCNLFFLMESKECK